MKTTRITILLFLFVLKVCAQNNPFKKGSLWIQQLMDIEKGKQLDAVKRDSNVVKFDRMNGNVAYSPDSCLRVGQVSMRYDGLNNTMYATTVQYSLRNKTLELKLPTDTDNYDFQDFPVTHIYKLPNPQATYLILSTQVQKQADQISDIGDDFPSKYPSEEEFKKIEKMYHAASLVHIVGDSLKEIEFKTGAEESDQQTQDIISGNSLYFKSRIQNAKHAVKPFLKYDAAKKELRFLTTYCDDYDTDTDCNAPYIHVYSGTFKYRDTAFTLVSDTGYFFPSLKSLDKTIAIKKFKTGNYITQVIATEKYEEVGGGVLSILNVDYKIQSQSIGYESYMFDKSSERNFKPEFKVQKNSSLIFLISDTTTPNHGGMCGGGEYDDSSFWLINEKNKKKLFSFSSSSCDSYTTYTYNNGKSDITGKFYVKNNSDIGESGNSSMDKTYWKNNDTYVFHVSDETLSRNFYVRFVTINKKTVVKLIVGKLEHKKSN